MDIIITAETFPYFADTMAYGMNMIQYNRDCFGMSDLNIHRNGYWVMHNLLEWLLEHRYSPEKLLGPSLRRFWVRDNRPLAPDVQRLDLSGTLPDTFRLVVGQAYDRPSDEKSLVDLDNPYLAWYEAAFREEYPADVPDVGLFTRSQPQNGKTVCHRFPKEAGISTQMDNANP